MNYLSVESLSKTYGLKTLFKDITFGINKGQRVALVARNGTGKSTLLKILMGKETPDSGSVSIRKDIMVTYLDQNPDYDEQATVMDIIYNTESPLLKAVKAYELALATYEHDHSDKIAEQLERATSDMDHYEAWDYEVKIKNILTRLKVAFLDRKIGQLSGGQKKRLALAQVLINEPHLLVLDEPTNHLDVEMIEWLEEYLVNREITLLVVTHDRYFLDRICTEIVELENGKLYTYKGDFTYYVEKKSEREAIENSEIDKAKNLYRKELDWVRRMPKARGTKSKARLDAFDVIDAKAHSRKKEEKLVLDVKTARLGGKILELIKISKAYGDLTILNQFSYIFKKGDKIGIVGKNGVGKTTFLNAIMELEKIDAGKISTGETVVFGYYSQNGITLDNDKRVIEVVKDIAEFIPMADGSKLPASQLLTRFQFPPDVQYNYVSKLSGGEKRRLYLLTILVKNPNFLILDEPTNDLDLVTLNVLEDFLDLFQGCILIVSHDRYFMDKLVDHVFVFEGAGVVRDFPGNYTEYRDALEIEEEQAKRKQQEQATKPAPAPVVKTAQPASEKRKPTFKEKQEYEQLEKDIAELEIEKQELNKNLASGSSNHDDVIKWSQRVGEVMELLDEKGMRWLELSEIV